MMRNEKLAYLIAFVIFSFLTIGYIAVTAVDFYYGFTPAYLTGLHLLATVIFAIAAGVNFARYRKAKGDKENRS